MSNVQLRVAAKAVISHKGKILIVREAKTYQDGSQYGKYGLPGGRIEADEPFFDALSREVKEEVGLSIKPIRPVYVGEWWPEINGIKNHIIAMFVLCEATTSSVKLSEEHDDFRWIELAEINKYDFMDPDVKVLMSLEK